MIELKLKKDSDKLAVVIWGSLGNDVTLPKIDSDIESVCYRVLDAWRIPRTQVEFQNPEEVASNGDFAAEVLLNVTETVAGVDWPELAKAICIKIQGKFKGLLSFRVQYLEQGKHKATVYLT